MEKGSVTKVSEGVYHLELDPHGKEELERTKKALAAGIAYDMQIRSNNTTYFDRLYELKEK